uniref:TetR/AcrR family transcriptional regulator n=1 Tax=Flavobacterium sp. TaxID=239 RepID=UPI00404ABF7E
MQDDILEKATDMFLNFGFKSVTMDDIANEMGISKKTIYQHYSNKNDLVEATTMRMFKVVSEGIDLIRNNNSNAIEELFEIKDFVLKYLKDEKTSPMFQLQKYFPKTYQALDCKKEDKMCECVGDNLSKGIKDGLYRPEINSDFINKIYYHNIHLIKEQNIFEGISLSIPELERLYLEYHVRAICTPKGLAVLESILNHS